MDHPEAAEQLKSFKRRFRKKVEIIQVSATENEGIDGLKARLGELVGNAAAPVS